jgi:glycosyltransferase involved in cell wall biosynthesis
MRYWDVAQQLYPSSRGEIAATHWRRLVRQLVGNRFLPVDGETIDPDLAAALASRPSSPVPKAHWPKTMHCIGTLSAGGAERQLVNLMTELARRGHDRQTLLTVYPCEGEGAHYKHMLEDYPIDIRVNNEPIREEGVELIRANPEIVRLIKRLPEAFHAWTLDIWVDISLIKPDIAHFWLDHPNIWGAPAALLAGVPSVIMSTRNVSPVNFPYLYSPYMHPWYIWLSRCPRVHMINNSHAGAENYAEWLGIDASAFEVILNGVDLSHLNAATPKERTQVRSELALPETAPVVVGAFRMSDEKRPTLFVDTFAKACAAKPDLHGVLMGVGPRLDDVKARAEQLGVSDRLRCIGRRRDLPRVMSAMDVFLHTAWWEGTPNVVLEAQQLSLPVVVSKGGGSADAVDHGRTGYLVDREDDEGLAARLIEILHDLDAWKRKAASGPAFIEQRFSVDRMVDLTLRFQRRTLTSAPIGAGLKGLERRAHAVQA